MTTFIIILYNYKNKVSKERKFKFKRRIDLLTGRIAYTLASLDRCFPLTEEVEQDQDFKELPQELALKEKEWH